MTSENDHPGDVGGGNYSAEELAHFEKRAQQWWDPRGEFRTLHQINPLRANYIDERSSVAGKQVLDVGCGGGLLCEALARRGGQLAGLELGENALETARRHMGESGLEIDYHLVDSASHAARHPGRYDVVCCMELLEHVPDPAALVRDCAELTKAGGDVYFSTINRTPEAWLSAILIGEYLLKMLPEGTHRYEKLIRPSELAAWARAAGLTPRHIIGIRYNPLSRDFHLGRRTGANYIMHATRGD